MSKYSGSNANVLLSDSEATYYDNVLAVNGDDSTRVVSSDTPAQARAKDIARHRAILKKTGGLAHLGAPSRTALMELGTGGV